MEIKIENEYGAGQTSPTLRSSHKDSSMEEIFSMIQKLSETVSSYKLEHPNDAVFRVMLLSLEELQSELHKSSPEKEKVSQIHYGILRAYQDLMSDIENRDFHEEVRKLLVELNNF